MQLGDLLLRFIVEAVILFDRFRTDVGEVDEATGDGQVRRRRQRRDRFRSVHGVDEDEISAGLRLGTCKQIAQIIEIANAPGVLGTDGIQLSHPAPQLAVLQILDEIDALGGADERGVCGALASLYMKRMVSERQIRRNDETRIDDELTIERIRRCSIARLRGNDALILRAILQRDGCLRHIKRTMVDGHGAVGSLHMQHGGFHKACMLLIFEIAQRLLRLLFAAGIDSQCRKHLDQDIVVDLDEFALLPVVGRGNAMCLRKSNERSG